MERRTFIVAGACLSATTTATTTATWRVPWLRREGLSAEIALVDTSLPESVALLTHAARTHLPAFDINDAQHADIAALWYETLAPRAARKGGRLTLIGVTRASDFFVLSRLALQPGAALMQTHDQAHTQAHTDAPQSPAVAFALVT